MLPEKDYRKLIGMRMKELRISQKLNMQEFAEKLSIQQPSVSRWESGARLPSAYSLMTIHKIFGTDLTELLAVQDEAES